MDKLKEAKNVFDKEIIALQKTRDSLDETFIRILDTIVSCKGKVIITGMGKPSHIARKLAATFSSLGTPSFCLHAAEAMHGDLGMIAKQDVVIIISYSGESDEIIHILPNIKWIGSTLIAITGNGNSTLAQAADIVQVLPKFEEACHLGLAPTSSTTAVLCYGDALAVTASEIHGFCENNFGMLHPAGSLGKKILYKVDDLMLTNEKASVVLIGAPFTEAIGEMAKKCIGAVTIIDSDSKLCGIITDGDLRRAISNKIDIYKLNVERVMTAIPKTIFSGSLAVDALKYMNNHNLSVLPVVDKNVKLKGMITVQDILRAGIVI